MIRPVDLTSFFAAAAAATAGRVGAVAKKDIEDEINNTNPGRLHRTFALKERPANHNPVPRQHMMKSASSVPSWLRGNIANAFLVVHAEGAESSAVTSAVGNSSTVLSKNPVEQRPKDNDPETAVVGKSADDDAYTNDQDVDLQGEGTGVHGRPGTPTEDEEEDENTCPFCLFHRRGPCGTVFRYWEKCVGVSEKNGKDIVSCCSSETKSLMLCMKEHPEYYALPDEEDEKNENSHGFEQVRVADDVITLPQS